MGNLLHNIITVDFILSSRGQSEIKWKEDNYNKQFLLKSPYTPVFPNPYPSHHIPTYMHPIKSFAGLFDLPRNTQILYLLGKQKDLRFLRKSIKSGNCLIYIMRKSLVSLFPDIFLNFIITFHPCIWRSIICISSSTEPFSHR